jgi:hypothetical protein
MCPDLVLSGPDQPDLLYIVLYCASTRLLPPVLISAYSKPNFRCLPPGLEEQTQAISRPAQNKIFKNSSPAASQGQFSAEYFSFPQFLLTVYCSIERWFSSNTSFIFITPHTAYYVVKQSDKCGKRDVILLTKVTNMYTFYSPLKSLVP